MLYIFFKENQSRFRSQWAFEWELSVLSLVWDWFEKFLFTVPTSRETISGSCGVSAWTYFAVFRLKQELYFLTSRRVDHATKPRKTAALLLAPSLNKKFYFLCSTMQLTNIWAGDPHHTASNHLCTGSLQTKPPSICLHIMSVKRCIHTYALRCAHIQTLLLRATTIVT